jgi:transcriptional regulator with XRE-family HTH domain
MQTEKLFCQTEDVSAGTSSLKNQLIDSLRTSKDYRHAFVEETIRTGLAAQIKAMREQREGGMTQKRFAEILGKSQSWVARLEDPNAAAPTLSTLLQVARAFDVDLEVRFAPFSELVYWVSGMPRWVPGLSSETLAVNEFEHDPGLIVTGSVSNALDRVVRATAVMGVPVAHAIQPEPTEKGATHNLLRFPVNQLPSAAAVRAENPRASGL